MDKLPKVLYCDLDTFSITLGFPAVNYALSPEDSLNELTPQEMSLCKFCYEHNHEVFIRFNKDEVKVYFDRDILMLMQDNFKHNLREFNKNNKPLRVDFVESCDLSILFTPEGEVVHCEVKGNINKKYILSKEEVSLSLSLFLDTFYELAFTNGYSL